MDPLSVAASVAGVATMGVQLSQTIYDLISTFYEAEKEMSTIANDLSLLAMVLNELEGVLRRDSRVYRRRMVRMVNEILNNCEIVFENISKYISVTPQDTRSSRQFQRKVRWYFQRHRVRLLQAGLESMKSTLNVVLHVVFLARVTEATETSIPDAGTAFTQADLQEERRVLVEIVLDNRRSIWNLKQIEEHRDRGQNARKIIEGKREIGGTDSVVVLGDSVPATERNLGPRETAENGGLNAFGRRGGGSSANTGTNTSFISEASKDSATDTTYSKNWSVGGNIKKQKDKITITGFDTKKSSAFDQEQGGEAEESNAGGDDDWGGFTTTNKKERKRKGKDPVVAVPNVGKPFVIDTTLGNSKAAADDSWATWGIATSKDKKSKKGKKERKQRQKEIGNNNRRSRDVSPNPSEPARSASCSEHLVEDYEVSQGGSSGRRPKSSEGRPELDHTNGFDDLPSSPRTHANSLSQSSDSVYYSMAPHIQVTEDIKTHYSEEDIPSIRQNTANTKGLATKIHKSQGSPPGMELVTPTAQWFLSVVPHESSATALIIRPRSGDTSYLRARAEETAKSLLLKWTNVDPDLISGEENSGSWNSNHNPNPPRHGAGRAGNASNQPYHMSYSPQAYSPYTPQQWYPPPVLTAPPPPDEKQTDGEELARLKKLILDEKAEQDIKAAAVAAAVPPNTPVAPIATEELHEDTIQRENTHMEAADLMQMPQEHNALWKAEPPRLQPVTMRDWLGRKFIFPVDMCQTWEGLHNLIQEAFGHVHKYRPMIEKGCYNISHVTGEVILPSTWEVFVQPGLEINMEGWITFDAERDDSGGTVMPGGGTEQASPKTLIPPEVPEVPTLGRRMALRSRNDNESSIDDVVHDDYSFPDDTSYVERSDPRYLSIETVLLEQKKAKVEAEMKLERNRRFFQLKQQLADQGAAIQAREDAADQTEQDIKLAWLEKQVRDQKEELDRLPPLLMTPPSSNAGDSLSKTASSPQRKPSFGARLLGQIPSRSIRSRGSIRSQQMTVDG